MGRNPTSEDSRHRRLLRLGVRVTIGLLLLVVAVHYAQPQALLRQLREVDALRFGLALCIAILANLVSALRWAAIARALQLVAPSARLVAMYARGITFNVLLPGATLSGDMLRSIQLARLGNPILRSALSVFFDRFSGLWTLCAMSFVTTALAASLGSMLQRALVLPQGVWLYALGLFAILVAPLLPWPIAILHGARPSLLRKVASSLEALRARLHSARPALRRSLWLSLVVQGLSAATLWLCAQAVAIDLSYWVILAAAAPIFVMAALPIGIAGFGTRELAAVAVLGLLGIPADQATAAALLYGLCAIAQGLLAAPLFLVRA